VCGCEGLGRSLKILRKDEKDGRDKVDAYLGRITGTDVDDQLIDLGAAAELHGRVDPGPAPAPVVPIGIHISIVLL